MRPTNESIRAPRLWEALIPVAALIVLIGGNIFLFGGDPQIPLVLATAVATLMGLRLGHRWEAIQDGIVDGIMIGMKATLILLVVGMVIGTWIASGVVPILIYYGLELLSPRIFLVASCAICCVVSLATGSSWTTAGTIGVALMGVAGGLGVPPPMAAGAIVSGAYFGDKMSPLSDSTNLAPAVAGSQLFEHIRHMVYTTMPALLIALVLYALMGLFVVEGAGNSGDVELIQNTLNQNFSLNPLLFIPPLAVIAMVLFRLPALPSLLGAALLGGVFAMIFQGTGLKDIMAIAQSGYVSQTGTKAVDELLTGGGLDNMMWTVSLILCALSFGGAMERTGMLAALAETILSFARSTGQLILATVGTCIGMNIIAPDQYLSIIVPGRMYREAYEMKGLHAKNLSRTLEDAGTLSSPLVPWNTCGAFMHGVLGVSALAYFPYAFLNLLTPLVAIFLGFMGWTIVKAGNPNLEAEKQVKSVQ